MSTKEFVSAKPQKGEIVFIHARVVQGAEVLMVGTDAWAQVVSTKSLGTKRVKGGKGQGESETSGTTSEASSGADGRAGSSIREDVLRGV